MSGLLAYGRMAETHWRDHCPRMVRVLETEGRLPEALLEAQERTATEMDQLLRDFRKQGLTPEQVREKYILLPSEQN